MHFLNSEIEFLDHENMGIDTLVELLVYSHSYADIDKNRFFGNGGTNQGISVTKPHPRPGSNTFL